MASGTLATAAAFSVAVTALYAYVGFVLSKRPTRGEEALANHAFVAWWHGLAVSSAVGALLTGAAAAGVVSLRLWMAVTQISLLAVTVALGGLMYYLLYVYTGRVNVWKPVAVVYTLMFAVLYDYIHAGQPTGVVAHRWSAELAYVNDPANSPANLAIVLLIIGPQLLGALAYFTLYWRVDDRTSKYRVAVVSWSIIVWFGSSIIVSIADLGDSDVWQVVSRLIGLAAALAILSAYRPPRWMQRRYGLEPLPTNQPPAPEGGQYGA